jgi:hypothetical protein
LKLSGQSDEISIAIEDPFVPPSTPIIQTGGFAALEPSVNVLTSDLNIPLSDYKWNQVVEFQLPDGKKVSSQCHASYRTSIDQIFQMVVDRTTWVTSSLDKSQVIYRLDTQLLIPL